MVFSEWRADAGWIGQEDGLCVAHVVELGVRACVRTWSLARFEDFASDICDDPLFRDVKSRAIFIPTL